MSTDGTDRLQIGVMAVVAAGVQGQSSLQTASVYSCQSDELPEEQLSGSVSDFGPCSVDVAPFNPGA